MNRPDHRRMGGPSRPISKFEFQNSNFPRHILSVTFMRFSGRVLPAAAVIAVAALSAARGQEPVPTPLPTPESPAAAETTPAPTPNVVSPAGAGAAGAAAAAISLGSVPTPTPSLALRIVPTPLIPVEKLPTENPYGSTPDVPAALPAKLAFSGAESLIGFFVSVHVDPTGHPLTVRRERDPIPSLAADSLKSIARWTFTPARRDGRPVETWAAYRLDLQIKVRPPKVLQSGLTPVTPTMPLPAPFPWPTDAAWLDGRKGSPPADGSVPVDQVDTAPVAQKTPWSADSYKGPFAVKFWVKIDRTGRITRAIPLEVSDPLLLAYFRRAMGAWIVQPAQAGGKPVESWNELTLGGQISYSDDVKQIVALKKYLGG
jgi:hypothetical protein